MKQCIVVALVLVAAGCMSFMRPDLSAVSLGMTKADVIRQLGRPTTVAANGNVEYLSYEWDRIGDGPYGGAWAYVRLVDGRVDSYGEKGDFGTTKDPTVNVNVDQTIRQR